MRIPRSKLDFSVETVHHFVNDHGTQVVGIVNYPKALESDRFVFDRTIDESVAKLVASGNKYKLPIDKGIKDYTNEIFYDFLETDRNLSVILPAISTVIYTHITSPANIEDVKKTGVPIHGTVYMTVIKKPSNEGSKWELVNNSYPIEIGSDYFERFTPIDEEFMEKYIKELDVFFVSFETFRITRLKSLRKETLGY